RSTATTDGSLRTIPSPFTYTRVFAVPRSTAMSLTGRSLPVLSIVRRLIWFSIGGVELPPNSSRHHRENRSTGPGFREVAQVNLRYFNRQERSAGDDGPAGRMMSRR